MKLETIFTTIAWGSTVLFCFKLILLAFGNSHSSDSDLDLDTDDSSDVDFKLFSLQSFLAFGMGFGWLGKAALFEWRWSSTASTAAGTVFGALMMVLSAFLMSQLRHLNHHYEPDLKDCIGLAGQTYLSIPEGGLGQIEISFGGSLKILDATSNSYGISQFQPVQVIAIQNGVLVVKAI
jgi:hypothetical protein